MIISRYLTKEILTALLTMTFVLLLIFLSKELVRYLGYAAAGKLGANILLQLMGLEIPYLLALLLPLGLYLGIIVAYGRLYADSELRVLHACGLSVSRLFVITSFLAVIVTAVVLVLTLWVNPWLSSQKEKLIARSISTDNFLETLMPGRFHVSSDGKRVVYVESITRNKEQANNVFIADQGNSTVDDNTSSWTVVSAVHGLKMKDPVTHDHFIAATEGYRYAGVAGQNDFKIIKFKKYAVRMPHIETTSTHQEQESIATATLWKSYHDSAHAAELQWRLSIPLSALLLGLLAIPLSHIHPRQGRYSQILPAILIYIIYMNLLLITRNWIEQKFLPIGLGPWWVHCILLCVILLFVMIQLGWHVKYLMRRSA